MLDRSAARGDLLPGVAAAVAGGVDWVQIRERGLDGAELLAFAEAAAGAARDAAARAGRALQVIVNRRADVALAARADGVHLGFDGMPAETARQLLGRDALIGIATHRPEELTGLVASALSYAHLAPIFSPLSKASSRPPVGPAALREATRYGVPILAQGGIEAGNAGSCIGAGAAGVAVTGSILASADPAAAAAALRKALDS